MLILQVSYNLQNASHHTPASKARIGASAVQSAERVASRLQNAAFWGWSSFCYTSYTMS